MSDPLYRRHLAALFRLAMEEDEEGLDLVEPKTFYRVWAATPVVMCDIDQMENCPALEQYEICSSYE